MITQDQEYALAVVLGATLGMAKASKRPARALIIGSIRELLLLCSAGDRDTLEALLQHNGFGLNQDPSCN